MPDTLHFLLGAEAIHDSNLFRLPDSVDPVATTGPSRSDTTRSAYVGFNLDQPYSLQRFQLNVTETLYRHEQHEDLDFDALAYRGAWLWQLTPRFGGVLSADHSESAVPFSDFEGTQRNTRKTDNRTFSVDGTLFSGWHLIMGARTTKQTSSLPVAAEADFQLQRKEIGLRYILPSQSSVALIRRADDGDYLNRAFVPGGVVDESFREHQTELQSTWVVTGRSTLTARLTSLDRKHPNLPQRNFDTRAGSVSYAWAATGKLDIALTAQRDVSAALDPLTPYARRDTLSIAPVWAATGKATVRFRLARVRTDYVFGSPTAPPRVDDTDIADFGVTWAATRNLNVSFAVLREQRSVNQPGLDYRALVTRVGASFVF